MTPFFQCKRWSCWRSLPTFSRRCLRIWMPLRLWSRRAARKRAAVDPIMCATCGAEFRPIGKQRYCSVACRPQSLRSVMAGEASAAKERKRGETAVILPSERKPKRTGSMTDSEFVDALAGIRPGQRSEMREMLVRRLAARMAATKTGYAKRETGEAA